MAEPMLPDCRARVTRDAVYRAGQMWIPLFCGNCHKDSGKMIPEQNRDFAFYLCEPCAENPPPGVYLVPDEEWFKRCQEAQLEEFGRELTLLEQHEQLSDPDSRLSMLVRDQPLFGGNS